MTSETVRRALEDLIQIRSGAESLEWLKATAEVDESALDERLSELPKTFGTKHLIAGFKDRHDSVLITSYGAMPIGHWRTDRAARAWLLATRAAQTPTPFKALFSAYDHGDTETRVAA